MSTLCVAVPLSFPKTWEIFRKQALVVKFGVQGVGGWLGVFERKLKVRSEFQNCSVLVFN